MFKSIRVGSHKSPLKLAAAFAEQKNLPQAVLKLDKADSQAFAAAQSRPGFKGDLGETSLAPDNEHLLLGLGKKENVTTDQLRTAGGRLVKQLDRMATPAIELHIADIVESCGINAAEAGQCVAEGISLANWRVDEFDGAATQHEKPHRQLTLVSDHKEFANGLKRGLQLADAANYARRLAATPPNICNPTWVVKESQRLARSTGLKCRVINYNKARELGMGGLVNVGKASSDKPALVILEHKPERIAKNAQKVSVALVGKTITFDTGGYSLKVGGSMKGMKNDKNGGMAVVGAMKAIAELKLPVHVYGLLPTAENMVSDEAYRPDDIITMYNGVSVEVTNTDAEGRLVLADALAYCCDKIKPTHIVDVATLTGGVVVGLGHFSAGLWCNDDELRSRLQQAADATGEKVWHMPLWEEHRDFMRAKHADLWNSAPSRNAHPIQGAAFLSFFVDDKPAWAHLDIAGMSAVDSDKDLYVTGPTGYGARLLADFVGGFAATDR